MFCCLGAEQLKYTDNCKCCHATVSQQLRLSDFGFYVCMVVLQLCICLYIYIYIGFKTFFYVVPTPRLHCFLSSHWPSFRFLSFMAFLIPSIQLFFGLPRALFCFGIHFNAILGNLPPTILWTWPYHVSWFRSVSFTIVSSSPICCLWG